MVNAHLDASTHPPESAHAWSKRVAKSIANALGKCLPRSKHPLWSKCLLVMTKFLQKYPFLLVTKTAHALPLPPPPSDVFRHSYAVRHVKNAQLYYRHLSWVPGFVGMICILVLRVPTGAYRRILLCSSGQSPLLIYLTSAVTWAFLCARIHVLRVCVRVCVCTCVYICICICVCTCVYLCVYVGVIQGSVVAVCCMHRGPWLWADYQHWQGMRWEVVHHLESDRGVPRQCSGSQTGTAGLQQDHAA